jgi:hypothetical protein
MGAGSGKSRQIRGLITIHRREGNSAAGNPRLIAEQKPGFHFIGKVDLPPAATAPRNLPQVRGSFLW